MKRNLLLTFFAISSLSFALRAQTIAGGEIYYELISSKKYKITAHLYRMCDYSPLNNLNASVYGGNTVVSMNFQRIAISRINDSCGNPCNKQNAASNPGFEKHTYIDTVDFNAAPYDVFVTNNICLVHFGIRNGGRFSGLTTLNSGTFYLDAATNICLSNITQNTSPQFSMEPKFYASCNLPLNYSPGPVDTTDNDSFSFSLVEPQSNYNTSATYKGTFNPKIPMSGFCLPPGIINCTALPNAKPPRGFYFDANNGNTIFTPSSCNEIGLIKYRLDEYRYNVQNKNYEWLGYVTREMMMQVKTTPDNNPPVITTPSSTALSLCEGNKVCLTISSADTKATSQKAADTTSMYWDYGIKGASFRVIDPTARERQGEFCWQTKMKSGRVEPVFFTVAAYDKKCNVGLTTKTYKVKVVSKPEYTYTNTIGKCGLVKWTQKVYDSFYNIYNISSLTTIKSAKTNTVLYSGTGLSDSAVIHENGLLIIEHSIKYNNGGSYNQYNCGMVTLDTLTMNGAFQMPDIGDNNDQLVCKDGSAGFVFKPSGVSNLAGFKWYLNDVLFNQKDSIVTLEITGDSRIKLRIENTGGCIAERVLNYTIRKHDAVSSVAKTYCIGDTARVKANIAGLKNPLNYQWKINGVDTAINDSILNFRILKNSKVQLVLKDTFQCPYSDSVLLSVNTGARFTLSHPGMACRDSFTTIHVMNFTGLKPYVLYWNVNGKDTVMSDTFIQLKVPKDQLVILKIKDKTGCFYTDSVFSDTLNIKVISTPQVKLNHTIQTCYNGLISIVPVITNRQGQLSYLWSFNKAIISTDSVLKRTFTSFEHLKLKVSNQLNCSTEDTVNVNVLFKPSVKIIHNSFYHPSSRIIANTTGSFNSYLWFNGKTTASDSFWASDLGPPGKYKIWCRVTDANGCVTTDTSLIFTNQFLSLQQQAFADIKIYPVPVTDVLTLTIGTDATASVFAADGRFLMQYTLFAGENKLDLSRFSAGVYLIRLKSEEGHRNIKIIKE